MADRYSLRPTSGNTRLGPSTDFFAGFRSGAGKHLRSKNRESQWDEKPNKKPEDRVRYSRSFLLSLKEGLKELPPSVNPHIACFVAADAGEIWTKPDDGQGEKGNEGETIEESNWRLRPTTESENVHEGRTETTSQLTLEERMKVSQLQRAEELGREAYRPRQAQDITDNEKAVRQVNGTLNKLTPDNFDRLVQQITDFVSNADVLRKTISLVFEKAVAEPTFCALYANLCERLSKQIPDFPPLEGETQKLTFRRILLNTCQDEFEGVESSREKLESIGDPLERELTERAVKGRTLGNVRLISELFNKGLVAERIIHSCIKDLLYTAPDISLPHEDNLEAVCEVLTLAGKKLAQGQMYQSHVPVHMTKLEKFAKTKGIQSRIVFLIRDVMDMQRNDWVPRREKFTAKKIEEIHAEAETELGIQIKMPQHRHLAARVDVEDDLELFPMPKGLTNEGEWKAVAQRLNRGQTVKDKEMPPEEQQAPTLKKEFKTDEEREKASLSMFQEYLSSADKKEAVLCGEEICQSDPIQEKLLIQRGLYHTFDCVSSRDHRMMTELLVWLVVKGAVQSEAFVEGLQSVAEQLDDLALDVPKSPELCGGVVGSSVAEGQCTIDVLPQLCQSILSAEIRRPFALAAFSVLKEKGHNVAELMTDAGLQAETFLKAHPEYDLPDLESVEAFLKKADFADIPH